MRWMYRGQFGKTRSTATRTTAWAPSKTLHQIAVGLDGGGAIDPHPVRLGEVDEQHPDAGVHDDVAEAAEHAVAVVARERDRLRVEDRHETRSPALVRAVGPAVLVRRRQEEHRALLHELDVVDRQLRVQGDLLEPVGDPPTVEAILQRPRAVVVHRPIAHHASAGGAGFRPNRPSSALGRVGAVDHDRRSDGSRGTVRLLDAVEPSSAPVHDLGGKRLVLTGRAGEVPRVDERVRGELPQVLLRGEVAEGEMDGAVQRRRPDRLEGRSHRLVPRRDRIVAEEVTIECRTDIGDGRAAEQRRDPPVLADDVIDQRTHVPVGARCRPLPALRRELVDSPREGVERRAVQITNVHAHLSSRVDVETGQIVAIAERVAAIYVARA